MEMLPAEIKLAIFTCVAQLDDPYRDLLSFSLVSKDFRAVYEYNERRLLALALGSTPFAPELISMVNIPKSGSPPAAFRKFIGTTTFPPPEQLSLLKLKRCFKYHTVRLPKYAREKYDAVSQNPQFIVDLPATSEDWNSWREACSLWFWQRGVLNKTKSIGQGQKDVVARAERSKLCGEILDWVDDKARESVRTSGRETIRRYYVILRTHTYQQQNKAHCAKRQEEYDGRLPSHLVNGATRRLIHLHHPGAGENPYFKAPVSMEVPLIRY